MLKNKFKEMGFERGFQVGKSEKSQMGLNWKFQRVEAAMDRPCQFRFGTWF